MKKYKKANVSGNIYINSIKNLSKYKKFVNKDTIPFLTFDKKKILILIIYLNLMLQKKWFKGWNLQKIILKNNDLIVKTIYWNKFLKKMIGIYLLLII